MSSKTLLTIGTIDTPVSDVEQVISLAQSIKAHLNIVVIGSLIPPPATIYGVMPDDFNSVANMQIFAEVKSRVSEFEKLVQKTGLSASVVGEVLDGFMITSTVARYALYSDLTIFKIDSVIDEGIESKCFNGALFDTGRPILTFMDKPATFPKISKVLIAWNGTPQAAKAIHHALPYLAQNADVHVVVVDPSEADGPHPGDDMAAFLARHGLAVTVDLVPGRRREIADVLTEKAVDIDAELIVMGGYGHSRLREWMFGGTTRTMLATSKIPLLMAN